MGSEDADTDKGTDAEPELEAPPARPERPAARRPPPRSAPPARTRVGRGLLPDEDEADEADDDLAEQTAASPALRADTETEAAGAEDEIGDLEGAERPAPRRRPEPRRRPVPSTGPLLPPDEPAGVPELVVEESAPRRPARPRPDPTAEPRPLDPLLVGQPELSEEFIAVPEKRAGRGDRRAARAERRPRRERTEKVVVEEGPTPPVPPGGPGASSRNRVAMIVLLVLLVGIVLGVGYFLFLRDDEPEPITTPVPTVATTPVPTTAPTPEPTPEPSPPAGLDDKDCNDFASQQEAQNFYIESGGPTQDLHGIDPDGNGVACEELSSPQPSPQPT